jgi:transcriptional regulator with XRE-family HTH domain
MTVNELRSKRVAAEIPATLLAAKAGVNRSRLSNLERGYAQPTEEELQRLTNALEQLIAAKASIQKTAAAVGWPLGEAR